MTPGLTFDQQRVEEFLLAHGADQLPHAGGSLYDHLRRVTATLREWGADPTIQAAALCHACYGTDGFATSLLDVTERATLADLIGPAAESLVYLYGSCDRDAVYPRLANPGEVPFLDRFTGRTRTPPEPDVRAFVELTAANELDVVAHSPAIAAQHGPALFRLFVGVRDRMSAAAWRACTDLLGHHDPASG
jgi:Domain of unknown function (DUF6817)